MTGIHADEFLYLTILKQTLLKAFLNLALFLSLISRSVAYFVIIQVFILVLI